MLAESVDEINALEKAAIEKELIEKFILVCKSFCSKENEIRDKFKKLTPENAKSNN